MSLLPVRQIGYLFLRRAVWRKMETMKEVVIRIGSMKYGNMDEGRKKEKRY